MFVPGRTPPAARRASATREPAGRRWIPGFLTLPLTSTTISGEALAPGADGGPAAAPVAEAVGPADALS